jgi:hypothetical protein
MMVVSTTGHIISSLGPYFSDGKNNDANILIHGLKTNAEDMSNWAKYFQHFNLPLTDSTTI